VELDAKRRAAPHPKNTMSSRRAALQFIEEPMHVIHEPAKIACAIHSAVGLPHHLVAGACRVCESVE